MLADLVAAAGVVAALIVAAGWVALVTAGLRRADEVRFMPQGVWVLLCVFSPVTALAWLAGSRLWSRCRGRRAGRGEQATVPQ